VLGFVAVTTVKGAEVILSGFSPALDGTRPRHPQASWVDGVLPSDEDCNVESRECRAC
jgi:hypothetical protein